jgi:hypothetical protein
MHPPLKTARPALSFASVCVSGISGAVYARSGSPR